MFQNWFKGYLVNKPVPNQSAVWVASSANRTPLTSELCTLSATVSKQKESQGKSSLLIPTLETKGKSTVPLYIRVLNRCLSIPPLHPPHLSEQGCPIPTHKPSLTKPASMPRFSLYREPKSGALSDAVCLSSTRVKLQATSFRVFSCASLLHSQRGIDEARCTRRQPPNQPHADL